MTVMDYGLHASGTILSRFPPLADYDWLIEVGSRLRKFVYEIDLPDWVFKQNYIDVRREDLFSDHCKIFFHKVHYFGQMDKGGLEYYDDGRLLTYLNLLRKNNVDEIYRYLSHKREYFFNRSPGAPLEISDCKEAIKRGFNGLKEIDCEDYSTSKEEDFGKEESIRLVIER